MNQLAIFVVILMLIVGIVGCMAIAGAAVGDEDAPLYSPTTEPADREASRAEAEARALEAQEAIERARAEQIRAEGDRERARAAAEVERAIGGAAARAVDRQGRLLTAYIVAGQGKLFGLGLLVGVVLTTVSVAVAIEYRRVRSSNEDNDQ